MVFSWLRKEDEAWQNWRKGRLSRRMELMKEEYESIIFAKNATIKALKGANKELSDTIDDLDEKGLLPEAVNFKEGESLVSGLIEWIKESDLIPKQFRGAVIGYVKEKQPALDALARTWLAQQESKILEQHGIKVPQGEISE